MTLKNNLYAITERGEDYCLITLNKACFIYKAHFPNLPITPGVCIIQIAGELLMGLLNKRISLREIINAKFLAVINPVETEVIGYSFTKMIVDEINQTVKVTVAVASERNVCAKLSLLYNIDE